MSLLLEIIDYKMVIIINDKKNELVIYWCFYKVVYNLKKFIVIGRFV